ncbi:hypothetical protein MUN89_00020 [Halobacillus salinarum]|uniref:Uncharacterized protein n=1 Tax=Halobacillus salinarum TaxID=2932257 RepID=A0ABY4EIY8_9BACI|nr:hypothetical protein [Halobacillus salinarum]UOQ44422.1 hypothetical protein MUN89_00020 [Halobacillus salinarum]
MDYSRRHSSCRCQHRAGDVDVTIYPTAYYKSKTRTNTFPAELKEKLISLGYVYYEDSGEYYYRNLSGETVPNSFKEQTMAAIGEVVDKYLQEI